MSPNTTTDTIQLLLTLPNCCTSFFLLKLLPKTNAFNKVYILLFNIYYFRYTLCILPCISVI